VARRSQIARRTRSNETTGTDGVGHEPVELGVAPTRRIFRKTLQSAVLAIFAIYVCKNNEMTKLKQFVEDTFKWMEGEHTTEEYESKQKELNEVFNPMKYANPQGVPTDMPGPKVEEVD
jgi:hypothetical protein